MANLDTNLIVIIIIGLVLGGGGLLVGLLVIIFGRTNINERINQFVETPQAASTSTRKRATTRLNRFRYRLNTTLGMLNSEEFQSKLTTANWRITVSEYHLIRFFATLGALALGILVIGNWVAGVALAVIVFSIPGFLLMRAVSRRQNKFQDQLIDTLTLIKGAVSAGSSFLQSLDVVVDEMVAPASDEFRRVRREVELGLPLSQALTNLANRMESDDLFLVVSAVNINMQIGGNLTHILASVIETIRNRLYLFGEIRSLTSYARYTSYLLTLLPFLTALVLTLISPTYFEQLMAPGLTRIILIYALISVFIGNLLLRRISKIEV
ncbi:MAG: type II secretion system F family protein [Anaerolineales bacterium]|nr:type II secretion system F family protein [Anaerolineales bacterium]